MAGLTRKVDAKGRITLPEEFAQQRVRVDRLAVGVVRITALKAPRRVPSLDQLLSGVTPANLHGGIDFGPPVGGEAL